MALSKQFELIAFVTKMCEGQLLSEQQETNAIPAYIKVTKIEVLKPTSRIHVKIGDSTVSISRSYYFDADLSDSAPNHIKQAYQFLKTLPEFSDAVDC
jgi:hypothetical protein